jgi:hypothetical protein
MALFNFLKINITLFLSEMKDATIIIFDKFLIQCFIYFIKPQIRLSK